MHTNIVKYSESGKVVLGAVRLVDGMLQIDRDLPPAIIETLNVERAATKVSNEAFLIKLTNIFSGKYVRAEYVR